MGIADAALAVSLIAAANLIESEPPGRVDSFVAPATAAAQPVEDVANGGHLNLPLGGHRPPVDGPVLDPFRPPDAPWAPGNRGIEYDTEPGDPVTASAGGTVVFAGQVGGARHVTVRHSIDLVTTVAFVAEVRVSVGDRVGAGDLLAIAGESVHFTARLHGAYIDPMLLFSHVSFRVRLIPVAGR